MSIEHILQRHTSIAVPPDSASVNDTDNVEDLGGWGILRGQRDRALSLELRKKDDTVLAVPYALIEQYLYSPADGITLRVAGREIRVRGRKLNDQAERTMTVFGGLTRHRVSWLAEQSRSTAATSPNSTVIESIMW